MPLPSPLSGSVRRACDFLVEQRFFAVAVSSCAACTLLAGRFLGTGSREHAFLVWNLFLAWVPYVCSLAAVAAHRSGHPRRGPLVGLAGAAWLAFLPNAPYLVTDLFRLREPSSVPIFYDVALFAAFAWSGCILGATSLHAVRRVIAELASSRVGHAAAIVVIGLSGLGMYLGRVVRLNSWDLALRPGHVLAQAEDAMRTRAGVFHTLLFAGFFFVCYVAMADGSAGLRRRETRVG
jgi:uncharacterized membrane protein